MTRHRRRRPAVLIAAATASVALGAGLLAEVAAQGGSDCAVSAMRQAFTLNGTSCTDATASAPSTTAPSSAPSAGASASPSPSGTPRPSTSPSGPRRRPPADRHPDRRRRRHRPPTAPCRRPIDAVPANNTTRRVITIKPGTYREIVTVPSNKPLITLQGLGCVGEQHGDRQQPQRRPAATAPPAAPRCSSTATTSSPPNLTFSNDYDEGTPRTGRRAEPQRRPGGLRQRAVARQPGHAAGQQRTRAYIVELLRRGHRRLHLRRRHRRVQRQHHPREAHHRRPDHRGQHRPRAKTYGFLFYRCTITGAANDVTQLGRPWRPGRAGAVPRVDAQRDDPHRPAVDRHVRQHLAERPVPRVPQHRLRREHATATARS